MKHHGLMIACSAALCVPLAGIGMVGDSAKAQQAPIYPPPLVQPQADGSATAHDANAQPPLTAGTSPESGDDLPLARPYESLSSGISFRPPADCKLVDAMSSKYIAEWADIDRDWTLKLGKMVLDKPAPLVSGVDNLDKEAEGILNKTVKNLKAQIPGARILRQDVTNTRDSLRGDLLHPEIRDNVGLVALRYVNEGKDWLSQQAIIQANDGVYYLLTLRTPGAKINPADDKAANDAPDPKEVLAVNTFSRMIDSVRLLDRKAILDDQNDRLIHTRNAIVNWTSEKLHRVMLNEQWLRIIKDGKDIGYSYITEDQAGGIPRPLKRAELKEAQEHHDDLAEQRHAPKGDGILIGVRAGTTTEGVRSDKKKGLIQTDSASWFFVSADKKHEDFSRVVVIDDHIAKKKGYVQEFGLSDKRDRRIVEHPLEDQNAAPGAINLHDRREDQIISFKEDWELDVTTASNSGNAAPLMRKLPPWYVPQALAHLLPRLLPIDKPQGYLFAVYVSDAREVVMRYMDVLPEQNVVFNGQQMRAIPIRDRLGLEGSVTIHYMSLDGNYLGSENKDQKLILLPTNDVTIKNIWAEAKLTRPDGVERGGPADASLINPTR
jgi:hypothetical protein